MSAIVISEELLAEAKNFLDITWEDEDSDKKLEGQLRRGIDYISAKTGVDPSGRSIQEELQVRYSRAED